MPGKVKVKILAGRNLPVMDRSSDTTDAYVEIKLGNTTYKTDVCRKSLNPQWNSEWYRFEVDDSELQDEPLQIRLMDHDTYSANDAIGKVYLNLNPLLIPAVGLPPKYGWSGESTLAEQRPSSSVLSGWVPVYDTMHGIRGEVNVTVKVELFSDFNKFRQSSCGVQFFCSPIIPHGHLAQVIHGFVEELVVNDDPEYQWIDKIRTPRASNEARQTLFFKLSGELQRKIGVKALDLGGNAVIGYNQCFDLEGESGIVARGIGTVVTLLKQHHENQQQIDAGIAEERAIGYLNFLAYSNGLKLNEIQELDSFAKSECASNNIISSVVPLIDTSLQTQHSLSNQKFLRQFSQPVSDQSASSKQTQIRTSASTKSLTDDIMKEIVLERLLQQEDERGYVSNNKLSRKIKNFKSSSHSLITKKMFEIKSRLSDSNMQEIDSKKMPKPTRSSLIDLRDLRKKKKSQIRNNSCMAELLVRSVITADTNLGCIAEGHDPIASTSSASESHDKFDVSELEIPATVKSDSCVSIINKTISEPYLFLKDTPAVTPLSTADSSSSESSSSDDDVSENLSDVKEDDKIDFDTVSLIVKNVTENNAQDKASKDFDFTYLDLNVVNTPEVQVSAENNDNQQRTISLTLDNPNKISELFLSHVLNTNEFCYSAPTHIDRTSDNVFVFPTCSENKIEELMHSSILNNTFNENTRSKSCEDVSLFPVETQVDVEHQSLMKTAMQTMLLEKVNLMTSHSPPPLQQSEECPSFPSTSPKHSGHKSLLNVIKDKYKTLKIKPPKPSFVRQFLNKHRDFIKHKEKQPGLVESAMNTILMDKVNNLKGILLTAETNKKSKDKNEKEPLKNVSEIDEKPDPCSVTTNIENSNNNKPISESVEKSPNINLRLDNGTILKPNNLANSNTNAEHAPCFYPFVRRIVESPVMEKDITREKHGHQRTESTGGKMSQSPARLNAIPCIHRRSSDSDLSITPKGNSLTGSDRSSGNIPHGYYHMRNTIFRPTVDNFDMMEYPFLTMTKYPPGFILHLGGAVSARSVKLLERITNIEEPETRDTWWSELRMEIRSHARALNCNAVLGYTEQTSICDEVCVLSASGTAAVIAVHNSELSDGVSGLPNLHKPHIPGKDIMTNSLDRTDFERENKNTKPVENVTTNKIPQAPESPEQETNIEFPSVSTSCRICHVPYNESSVSFRVNMQYCSTCKVAKVPDILLATIEIPEGMPINGRGCFLQSYVCRSKRDLKGELNAKEISESLPFLEYELHRLLVNKMKVKGMNTIFGLRVRITIGEKLLVGIATGTAIFLLPLPPPPLPKLVASNSTGTAEKKLSEMQKLLVDTVKKNKEVYEVKLTQDQDISQGNKTVSDTDESDEEKGILDLGVGNKDSCVLEIDDSEDIEVISLLIEPRPPDGFHVVNTETVPGLEDLEIVRNLQMFTQIWRTKIPLTQTPSHFGKTFQKLLQSIYFKLRRMIPCALCDLQFRIDLPEPDEIQLSLLGMALGLGDPMKTLSKYKRKNLCHLPPKEYLKKSDDEMIFSLEDDHIPENSIPTISQGNLLSTQMPKHRQKSPQRLRVNTRQRHTPIKERHGVDITPLSYVPGGKIERYLGYLNFFFIRETTSIREGGGLSGFVHSFITEVLAIVRAHVTALGGNAMVAYFMTECVLYHNAHKNQGQCLINVGGDVVFVSYYTEDV